LGFHPYFAIRHSYNGRAELYAPAALYTPSTLLLLRDRWRKLSVCFGFYNLQWRIWLLTVLWGYLILRLISYCFLTPLCVFFGLSWHQDYWKQTEGIGNLKISKDPTGNRARNCSTAILPLFQTQLTRAPWEPL